MGALVGTPAIGPSDRCCLKGLFALSRNLLDLQDNYYYHYPITENFFQLASPLTVIENFCFFCP